MGLLTRLKQAEQAFRAPVTKKAFDPLENIDLNKVVGWHSVGGSNAYGFYKDHQYENGYSSIRVLAEAFMLIEQYTIDKTGNAIPSNILDRLYTPNTDMSAVDFREALMVCTLVHDKVRLRVHHKGQRINADSITGFTFMEGFSETIVGGKRNYRLPNGELLTDDEVITLKSVNPDSITDGFSPSRAARRWTRLDDYIADYQRGFFENGAVPAGQFIVTAKTATEFEDIVDKLQDRHRGAGNNNNVTYSYRPVDPTTKQPLNAQIEWVPFSTQNKDMALKDLFTQANQKIDSSYGVPASLRAVNDANTYASVRVDEVILVKYALAPKTLKIWSKFNHELNRITGGTGLAIDYDLEIPTIADEEKVKAESREINARTVSSLIEAGYTPESAIEYVKTGDLADLIKNKEPKKEEPEVVSSDEIKNTPDQPIDPYTKSIAADLEIIKAKLLVPEKKPAKKPKKKEITDADKFLAETKVKQVVKDQLTRQVEKAIAELPNVLASKAYGDPAEDQTEQFVNEMMTVIMPVLNVYGAVQTSQGVEMILDAGLSTEGIQRFFVTEQQRIQYRAYLERIGTYFNLQTGEAIRKVLETGISGQASRAEIETGLRNIVKEQWRIDRLATTEISRAGARASVMSMANIKDDTGYTIEKTMQHNGADAICEFCRARLGVWYPVDESMVKLNEVVIGVDGGKYVNTWEDNFGNDIHANGHCTPIFRVRG